MRHSESPGKVPGLPWVPRDEASFKSQRDALIFLSPAGLLSFLLDYRIFLKFFFFFLV